MVWLGLAGGKGGILWLTLNEARYDTYTIILSLWLESGRGSETLGLYQVHRHSFFQLSFCCFFPFGFFLDHDERR